MKGAAPYIGGIAGAVAGFFVTLLFAELFIDLGAMKAAGMTILLVEQNVELALSFSDRVYVMDQGVIVHQDTAAALLANPEIQERYCSV